MHLVIFIRCILVIFNFIYLTHAKLLHAQKRFQRSGRWRNVSKCSFILMTLIHHAIDNDIDLHKDIFFGKLPITKVVRYNFLAMA